MFFLQNNSVGQKITSHVMTSSNRLPPPPWMFVGATTGTESNQEKWGEGEAVTKVHLYQEVLYVDFTFQNLTQARCERDLHF